MKLSAWLTSQAKLVTCQFNTIGESREAILTARHVRFCRKPCTPIAHIATLFIDPFIWLVPTLLDLGML